MPHVDSRPSLLLGIDLEDVRDQVPNGRQYQDRLEQNVLTILDGLNRLDVKGTFFTVGTLARGFPALLQEIAHQGHEIATHGDTHTQLTKLDRDSFRDDLVRNLEALATAQSDDVIGFRAPTFSLTEETKWAYEVLSENGIAYSSSVLPARNPLFGWPEFGPHPRMIPAGGGVLEIPVTLHASPLPQVPLAGGVYLRVLPFALTSWSLTRKSAGEPITTYIHPYDIDSGQERFMHPDLNESKAMNWLMYVNRDKALRRLTRLIQKCRVWRYRDWAHQWPQI